NPVLVVSNYVNVNGSPVTANMNALFRNCIFWGQGGLVDDEVATLKDASAAFNVNFDYDLWKVVNTPGNVTSTQIINNQDPLFDSVNVQWQYYDFRLKANSPAVNKGV